MAESIAYEQNEDLKAEVSVVKEKVSHYFDTLLEINKTAFPTEVFNHSLVRKVLKEKQTVLAVLTDAETQKIVGYALTTTTNKPHAAHYIANAIIPEFQGQRLVKALSEKVEEELRNKGFLFVTRDTRTSDGYADKVRKAYGKRVLKEEKSFNILGEYIEFTIEL
ncbi:hypothetical protein COU15_00900 [Candidatus Kaiserbacteria bacterium CG10_big_fil_rev_8_21_14_0_10_45_20]|uniref:N-acetyltransferase domain-containing protein n=1 Tax=Candidatus Kaiserbacteria bacterium CG10_big_fil_rev_8_21_14_0_10_45_20 TaxID=1974607 RepID=A0A2H0UG40_9BACT|nr:MAG: hypothetical protein COU15_00900 [Candidatus Kaiserbacteria bacterium CG10_big_fil_rev_8_21_14_0_10_45_20]